MTLLADLFARLGSHSASLSCSAADDRLAQPQDPGRPYWSDNWRGWHFYEEPEIPPPGPPASAPRQAAPASSAATAPRRSPEAPRDRRVRAPAEGPSRAPAHRHHAADRSQRAPLHGAGGPGGVARIHLRRRGAAHRMGQPELDPTLQGRPVNAKALEVFDQLQMAQRSQSIAPWAATMSCSSSSAATAPTAMPSRRRSRPSRPGTASRWSRSASTAARSPASRTPGGTTGSPPRCG